MINNKSRTIEEQIALLRERGMIIRDEEMAKIHLKSISYYRLKGYWWGMQSDKYNHIFYPNSCFEDVLSRYNFDRHLRLILFDAIEIIEIALRTKLIYHLSQSYGGFWYLDTTIVNSKHLYKQLLREINADFNRSVEVFVKEFRKKFSGKLPDAWMIFEVTTLGNLSKFYKNLGHQLPVKSKIANEFGLNLHTELSSWLEAISNLRNIVAHHSRIWSRNMVKLPTELHNPLFQWLENNLTDVQKKKAFYLITAMLYMCNAINPTHKLKTQLLSLFSNNPSIPIYKIGFFSNWREEPIWV